MSNKTKAGPISAGTPDREQFKALAAELRDLQDATKGKVASIMERALGSGFDPAGVRRFVAWKRQDEEKRAQRAAIDQQCRYLAGEVDAPATLPIGCELARALNCYRRKMTVRQAAEELSVSTGKAGNLYKLARMFAVHVHVGVDKPEAAGLPTAPPFTADPEQGAAGNSPPSDDAPQAEGRAPPAPPELATGAGDGTNQEPRSPAFAASDSVEPQPLPGAEPVVPTGNEGRAGERGTEEDLEVTSYRASRSDEQETPAARAGHESCGGVESGHAEDHGGGEPAHVQQVAEAERTPSAERTASLSTIAEHPREAAGVAPGPQDLIKEVAHGDLAAPEPELARAVPPVTAPVYVAVVEMAGELVLTNELGAVAEAQPPRVAAPSETVDWDEIIASQPAQLRRVPA